MIKTMTKKQLDKAIEKAWYSRACGVQVNIMQISEIFTFCRDQYAQGKGIEDAVDAAIAKYRLN